MGKKDLSVIFCVFLFCFGWFIYKKSLDCEFTMDDVGAITQNEDIRKIDIPLFFTTHYYNGSAKKEKCNLYRPLPKLSYAINYAQTNLNPKWYHLVNTTYHIITAIILFLLLMRFFPYSWVPFIASILFLVAPVNVKSVVTISNRCTILDVMFGLLAWYLHDKARERKLLNIAAAASLFLSLSSKETGIMWIFIIFLYDLCFYRKKIIEIIPLIIGVAIFFILRINAVGLQGFPEEYKYFLPDEGIFVRLFTMSKCIVFFYFLRGLMGINLVPVMSSRCVVSTESSFPPSVESLIAISIIIILIVVAFIKVNKVIAFWIAFFFISIFPSSNIIRIGTLGGWRFLYSAAISYWVLIAVFFAWLKTHYPKITIFFVVCLISWYVVQTNKYIFVFKNNTTIAKTGISMKPINPLWLSVLSSDAAEKFKFHLKKGEKIIELHNESIKYAEIAIAKWKSLGKDLRGHDLYRFITTLQTLCDLAIQNKEWNRAESLALEMKYYLQQGGAPSHSLLLPTQILAEIMWNTGRKKESIELLETSLPKSKASGISSLLAFFYGEMNKEKKALSILEEEIKSLPPPKEFCDYSELLKLLFQKTFLLLKIDSTIEALYTIERASQIAQKINPSFSPIVFDTYLMHLMVLYQLNRYNEIFMIEGPLRALPAKPEALVLGIHLLINAYIKADHPDIAKNICEFACRQIPSPFNYSFYERIKNIDNSPDVVSEIMKLIELEYIQPYSIKDCYKK